MAYEGYQYLLFEKKNGIAYITFNRPEVRNAMNGPCWAEIGRIFDEISADPEVRVAIMTGAGNEAFVAGADISMLNARGPLEMMHSGAHKFLNSVEYSPKFIIAAVNGYAFGGGCEIAMSADIRIATKKSQFGQLEINLGIIPSAGGTQRLPRLVGASIAKEMICTGKIIDADEAYRIGLVNHLVETQEDLIPYCEKLAKTIINKSPIAVELGKSAVNYGMQSDIQTGLTIERLSQAFLFTTEDKSEGTSAFLEKRRAVFTGR